MSHTPGPWSAENIGAGTAAWGVVADSGRVVVAHDFVAEGDARLIAAAPDLLAALKGLLCPSGGVYASSAVVDAARAAISKAEGQ